MPVFVFACQAFDLLGRLLRYDHNERATAAEALAHDYFEPIRCDAAGHVLSSCARAHAYNCMRPVTGADFDLRVYLVHPATGPQWQWTQHLQGRRLGQRHLR